MNFLRKNVFRGFLWIPRILTKLRSEKFEWFGPSPIEPFNLGRVKRGRRGNRRAGGRRPARARAGPARPRRPRDELPRPSTGRYRYGVQYRFGISSSFWYQFSRGKNMMILISFQLCIWSFVVLYSSISSSIFVTGSSCSKDVDVVG